MKSNKRFIQLLAAVWILLFHLWIPVTATNMELFLIKTGYIGVDLFFLVSAYSLADKNIEYVPFIKNRFANIYTKYVIFAIIAFFYKKMTVIRLIKMLTMAELFEKGGGAFLWFIPAIMIFYLCYPFFLRIRGEKKVLIALIIWLIAVIMLDKLVGYTDLLIVINRIPVILVGYLLKKKVTGRWYMLSCIPLGIVLVYYFGYQHKLNIPFTDFYYVLAVPIAIGIFYIGGYIKENRVWEILSTGTLEVYALQMIFGVKLSGWLYRNTGNIIVTNILVIIILFIFAIALAKIYKGVIHIIKSNLKGVKNGL